MPGGFKLCSNPVGTLLIDFNRRLPTRSSLKPCFNSPETCPIPATRHVENLCHFSPDRRHRYALIHRWNPLFSDRSSLRVGLNPSTANEDQLDPTLTRIAAFSKREGFDGFWMANLLGLRTPYPKEVKIPGASPGALVNPHLPPS